MDGISSSVSLSSLKFPPFHQPPRDFPPYKSHPQLPLPPPLSCTSKRNSFSDTPRSSSLKTLNPLSSSPRLSPGTPPPQFHRNPATGYAAALLDIALCKNSLDSVQKDARELSRVLRKEKIRAFFNDSLVGVEQKGELLKELAGKLELDKFLVRMVKMLIQKNNLGIVSEVLKEFEKIYDKLSVGESALVLDNA